MLVLRSVLEEFASVKIEAPNSDVMFKLGPAASLTGAVGLKPVVNILNAKVSFLIPSRVKRRLNVKKTASSILAFEPAAIMESGYDLPVRLKVCVSSFDCAAVRSAKGA